MRAFEILDSAYPQCELARFRQTYDEVYRELRPMFTVRGPEPRPDRTRAAHPFTQVAIPAIRRDNLSPGRVLSKEEYMRAALQRPSPFGDASQRESDALPPDLRAAIDYVAAAGGDIKRRRSERMARLRILAARLEPMRAALEAEKCETARLISLRLNVAWMACTTDAMGWADVSQPLRYMTGFPVVFDIPDSGVFIPDELPAEISREEFERNNTRAVAKISSEIEADALHGSADAKERRRQCWIRTKEEIAAGLVHGPYSRARMDKRYKRGKWRCLGRSAIWQKNKYRCIDNGKRSKHNKATAMHERITCGRADFPVVIAREFAKRQLAARARRTRGGIHKRLPRFRMGHGTNDIGAAYRHVPTSQPEYTSVAVWDDDNKTVAYCDVPGHNFGLRSSVVNFCRYPEYHTALSRRLLWCVCEHYIDDDDTAEPSFACRSGQRYLVELGEDHFCGFPFEPEKHSWIQESNEYLGVVQDLSGFQDGYLSVSVTRSRREKTAALIDTAFDEQSLASGIASSIFGKSRYMLSPVYGCLGKACLQPILQREYTPHRSDLTPEISESLEFIRFACTHMPPLQLPLLPLSTQAVVVFVDAEGEKRRRNRAPTGHVGWVVHHPMLGRAHGSAPIPAELVRLLDQIKKRDTYIGPFELTGAIIPFISLEGEWFAGMPVELYIDNTSALSGLIKGYSGKPDGARLINMFHFAFARLGAASLWIDYVASESNPADVPSRFHEMSKSQIAAYSGLLGEFRPSLMPTFVGPDGRWLSFVEIARSVWG